MALILNGRERECETDVVDWKEHGYDFNNAPSTVPRKSKPDLVMLHWTGGENGAGGLTRTLRARGLGVSFFVDRYGIVYQLLDPGLRDPRDVGGYHGRRTISVEIANYGFVLRTKVPKRGRDRQTDKERVHGMRLNIARFYPAQVRAVRLLCEFLCEVFELPLYLPRDRDGDLALRRLRGRELRKFKGVCGHLHKTDKKVDPGFLLFHILDHAWNDNPIPEKYGTMDLTEF